MKKRPILFNGAMVRAYLAGTKTQTRRGVKRLQGFGMVTEFGPSDTPGYDWHFRDKAMRWHDVSTDRVMTACPYGVQGDRLWGRETFRPVYPQDLHYNGGRPIEHDYRATYTHGDRLGDSLGLKRKWTPAIHMPRDASRIDLEVTCVRLERIQDISEADAIAEGIVAQPGGGWALDDGTHYHGADPRISYWSLWEAINGRGSLERNDCCWAITFPGFEP